MNDVAARGRRGPNDVAARKRRGPNDVAAIERRSMSTSATARSKTVATWLALVGGTLGLHRFYLHGWSDRWGWLLWPPTLLGAWGALRMNALGQDDRLAWVLVPLLGLTLSAAMLTAVVYGLTPRERWQARHDPRGSTRAWPWLDVIGAVAAAAIGAIALIATIAFVAQRSFEYAALQPSRGTAAAPSAAKGASTPH